jgi:SAM-dependent methyltransferase
MPRLAPRRVRRGVFGRDPATYDRFRLPYPEKVYEILARRCGLRPGAVVFEIGPGTGIATRELLRRGADPLTVIEPDRRLVRFLRGGLGSGASRTSVLAVSFERARLPDAAYDLGVAATSFHWLPERPALRKVGRALRPGGWWATWNNRHGDPERPSRFHRALEPLYQEISAGRRVAPGGARSRAFARTERDGHLRALASVGTFDRISREDVRWRVSLETAHVTALWGTFSEIVTLPRRARERFLRELGRIVDEEFGGKVVFPMLTPVYSARRV